MVGLQLTEVSGTSPAEVKIRYDIILQPIIVSWPMPRLPTDDFAGRDVQDGVYNYLDHIAQEVIWGSLAKEPVVGEEVHQVSLGSGTVGLIAVLDSSLEIRRIRSRSRRKDTPASTTH
jgi:hypothetical protein